MSKFIALLAFGIFVHTIPTPGFTMSLDEITEIARKHLKGRKSIRHLVKQISLVDRGIRTGFICGPPQPQFADLRNLMRQLHLEKVISDGCTVVAMHEEICIININKILDILKENLPIFVNVSGDLKHPDILEGTSTLIQQFLKEFRYKISNIVQNRIEFTVHVNLSAVLGLIGGFPVIYWCESDSNCLSMVPLRQYRATIQSEEILSFTVPEILTEIPKVQECVALWKTFMKNNEVTVQETLHQELAVVL